MYRHLRFILNTPRFVLDLFDKLKYGRIIHKNERHFSMIFEAIPDFQEQFIFLKSKLLNRFYSSLRFKLIIGYFLAIYNRF